MYGSKLWEAKMRIGIHKCHLFKRKALVKRGCQHVTDRKASRYVILVHKGQHYYVGKKGAVRVGATLAQSVPLNYSTKRILVPSLSPI